MLKKIRTTLAILFFGLLTLMFLDITGTLHTWFGWMAKIQFIPAILALNLVVVILLVALTLLFGRIYCSVICPLGVFQDLISWINGRRGKKKRLRFTYSPEKKYLRYGVFAIFIVTLVAGIWSLFSFIEPYSAYGRIVSNLFAPLYRWGNNLLAFIAERADSYAFYEAEVWIKSIPTFIIAIVTFVTILILAWRNGRTYCNTICPVGSILGFLSKYSLFKVRIDAEKCKQCSLCTKACKASCVDYQHHVIDYSRCVDCFNCIDTCPHGAIRFTPRFSKITAPRDRHEKQSVTDSASPAASSATSANASAAADNSRRAFITGAAVALTAATKAKAQKKVDGGLAVIEDKKVPKRETRLVPAGALSINHFAQHCTACQLCVSVCPNGVLRPSASFMTLMQPEMSFERGYCRPECNKCSEVCPTGAIRPITLEDKSSTKVGHAVWVRANCVVLTDGVDCGNCARHCPTGAIRMVRSDPSDPESKKIPAVNSEKCIGCGACEFVCPSRPYSAIYVEGSEVHHLI